MTPDATIVGAITTEPEAYLIESTPEIVEDAASRGNQPILFDYSVFMSMTAVCTYWMLAKQKEKMPQTYHTPEHLQPLSAPLQR